VNGQLVELDRLLVAGFFNDPLSQGCGFLSCEHPADHIMAENVEDHIEVVVGSFDRTEELGDIP